MGKTYHTNLGDFTGACSAGLARTEVGNAKRIRALEPPWEGSGAFSDSGPLFVREGFLKG